MKRIALTNNIGQWFDADKAECFKEQTYWNGSNHISKATNDQWHHEAIFKTKSGVFVFNSYSNIQGSMDTYEEITKKEAAQWFAKQGFLDEDIPEELLSFIHEFEVK